MSALKAHSVCVDLSGTRIVSDVSLDILPGQFVGLVGPNGSGKTTLLRSLHRALKPTTGSILIDGDDLWSLDPREAAQRIAVVAQDNTIGFDFTTSEVAAMGRIPHQRGFQTERDEDRRLVVESLDDEGSQPDPLGRRCCVDDSVMEQGRSQPCALECAVDREPAQQDRRNGIGSVARLRT